MKVSNSVRQLYGQWAPRYHDLRDLVEPLLRGHRDEQWHLLVRVKSEESFAQKLETGRVADPARMEDFLACAIVVQNHAYVPTAESVVRRLFRVYERRPKTDRFTQNPPERFVFDDLRLYCMWSDTPGLPTTGLDGLPFEVQVRTFLQHAWDIATHDLVYKSDKKDWAKERIAYQVKAMLEHAEVAISEAELLSKCELMRRTDGLTARVDAVLRLLSDSWPSSALPDDTKRLATSIESLVSSVGVSVSRLRQVLEEEATVGKGAKTLNLSPYGVVVQSLLNREPDLMLQYMSGHGQSFKVFLCDELELPSGFDRQAAPNVVCVPPRA